MAKSNEQSAFSEITEAGAKGAASPSAGAKIAGGIIAPPGAEDAMARGLQAGTNVAITGSKKLMEGVVRQHGPGPAAVLQDLKIKQAIATKGHSTESTTQTSHNKGIEAARQKSAERPTESSKSQSTNKGIESFQSKASGQSTSGTTKGAGSSEGKSSGSSSGSSQSSGGQGR